MELETKKILCLLLQLGMVLLVHLLIPLAQEYFVQLNKTKEMMNFNFILKNNLESQNILRILKILIHNYESLENYEILKCRDINVLENELRSLRIKQKRLFLKNSLVLNVITASAIILPGLSYSFKKLFKKNK